MQTSDQNCPMNLTEQSKGVRLALTPNCMALKRENKVWFLCLWRQCAPVCDRGKKESRKAGRKEGRKAGRQEWKEGSSGRSSWRAGQLCTHPELHKPGLYPSSTASFIALGRFIYSFGFKWLLNLIRKKTGIIWFKIHVHLPKMIFTSNTQFLS